jgi:hypothetical protein
VGARAGAHLPRASGREHTGREQAQNGASEAFLPLAAWIMASRRGEWDQLLAAMLVTVAVAIPVLLAAALVEVYLSPHLFHALTGTHLPGAPHWGE